MTRPAFDAWFEQALGREQQWAKALPWCTLDDRVQPTVGETLVATIAGKDAYLWRLGPRRRRWHEVLRAIDTALHGFAAGAEALVLRQIPWLVTCKVPDVADTLVFALVGPRHLECEPPAVVQGRSLELGVALVWASHMLSLPVPRDVMATARVDEDSGKLLGVEGLPEKIACVANWAPTIRRILVATDDATAARAAVPVWARARVEIVPCPDLREALRTTFEAALKSAMQDGAAWKRLGEAVFRTAGTTSRALPWTTLSDTAALLAARAAEHPDHAEVRLWLDIAQRVATRHSRDTGHATPLAFDATFAADLELLGPDAYREWLSHAVQSCTDGNRHGADEAWVRLAQEAVPVRDRACTAGDAKVIGALGRWHAARGDHAAAATAFKRALAVWTRLGDPSGQSYPLSAWLSSCADTGTADAAVDAAVDAYLAEALEPGDPGPAFVRVAALKAAVLLGQRARAETLAAAMTDETVPTFLRGPARRWKVRALRAFGRPAEADALLETARREAAQAGDDDPQLVLLEIDRAIAEGDDDALPALVQRFEQLAPQAAGTLLARPGPPRERARWIAGEWVYG